MKLVVLRNVCCSHNSAFDPNTLSRLLELKSLRIENLLARNPLALQIFTFGPMGIPKILDVIENVKYEIVDLHNDDQKTLVKMPDLKTLQFDQATFNGRPLWASSAERIGEILFRHGHHWFQKVVEPGKERAFFKDQF